MATTRARRDEGAVDHASADGGFPASAGILFGLGLGGFFDGIVLHQILQWHHMLSSAGASSETVDGLKLNTLADGLFHAATYVFVLLGLFVLWRHARRRHLSWRSGVLPATMLIGFGLFNLVEGLVNHQVLGLHHVNETVPRAQWLWWDICFLASGVVLIAIGWLWLRRARAA